MDFISWLHLATLIARYTGEKKKQLQYILEVGAECRFIVYFQALQDTDV